MKSSTLVNVVFQILFSQCLCVSFNLLEPFSTNIYHDTLHLNKLCMKIDLGGSCDCVSFAKLALLVFQSRIVILQQ